MDGHKKGEQHDELYDFIAATRGCFGSRCVGCVFVACRARGQMTRLDNPTGFDGDHRRRDHDRVIC